MPRGAPRQTDGIRQREHLQNDLHRAQRRVGKVSGGGVSITIGGMVIVFRAVFIPQNQEL